MNAGDLVREGNCVSGCLAAISDPSGCRCVCRGELHGLLSTADVSTLIDRRRYPATPLPFPVSPSEPVRTPR